MIESIFPQILQWHRHRAGFTNAELADRARVPESLIAGLQSGKRRVGEQNALQIGQALGLHGVELEHFIYDAINTSTRKLLKEAIEYPSQLLNFTARKLLKAGVNPQLVANCDYSDDLGVITMKLADGRVATLETNLVLT